MVIAKKGSLKGHRKGALGRTSAVPLAHSLVIPSGCTVNDCKNRPIGDRMPDEQNRLCCGSGSQEMDSEMYVQEVY